MQADDRAAEAATLREALEQARRRLAIGEVGRMPVARRREYVRAVVDGGLAAAWRG